MKEGINEKTLNKMIALNKRITDKIRLNLKGVKPFASKPVPAEDLIYAVRTLGYLDLQDLYRDYGVEQVNKLLFDVKNMENRRRKIGTIPEIPEQIPEIRNQAPLGGLGQRVEG